jgi:SAM-dependent methyltransferase
MSLRVLRNKADIAAARRALIERKASALDCSLTRFLRRLRLVSGISVGDDLKSWDVLATLEFLEKNVGKDQPILDIGCYASEIIVALKKSGFSNLSGVDLNPDLERMPYANTVRYKKADFQETGFNDASFSAITSISVIEHGLNATALLKETSRLLKTGGYFVASFDYWPEKIDTTGIEFFGMDWLIFSREDILDFVQKAKACGLTPVDDLSFDGEEKPIECAGKHYTFGWLVLRKDAR